MADFGTDIQNFQRHGTYTYKFDKVGNLIFNSSSQDFSQVYLAFPLTNIVYNNSKVQSFFETDFTDFTPTTSSVEVTQSMNNLQQQLDKIQQENVTLKTQLDTLIVQSDNNSSVADQMAIKQVVLELRKALGQGRVDSDFSTTFPYTAIRKPTP